FVYYNKASMNLIDKQKEKKYVAKKVIDIELEELKPRTLPQMIGDGFAFFLIFTLMGGILGMLVGGFTSIGMLGGFIFGLEFGTGLASLALFFQTVKLGFAESALWGLLVLFVPFGFLAFILKNYEERKFLLIRWGIGFFLSTVVNAAGMALISADVIHIGPP